MKKFDISRHLPPGLSFSEERSFFLIGAIAAGVYSLLFFVRFSNALSDLYETERLTGKRVLIDGAQMQPFETLYGGLSTGFYLLAAAMLFWALRHYLYHWQASKSVYLMRRLPNRLEWHRRCLSVPSAMALFCLAAAVLIPALYYGIYCLITPASCLGVQSFASFWRAIV